MYTRPTGKAYVQRSQVWWVVRVWNGDGLRPRLYDIRAKWRDALDTALWYNETYYHPTKTKEN